jgi:Doubled CXXCH motif (Paired_CXXCH_1)
MGQGLRGAAWMALFLGAAPAQQTYVGAAACGKCHTAQFAAQSAGAHAGALRRAVEHPLAASFAPAAPLQRNPGFRFQFELTPKEYRVRATDGRDVMDIPIDWAFGAGRQAVTFVSRVNEDWYLEHYFSYYAANRSLGITPGQAGLKPDSLPSAMGLLYKSLDPDVGIRGCFECHSTGPVSLSPAETGVRCEACHGAGSEHAGSGGAKPIGNPKRMSATELNQFCGRCHRPPGGQGAVTDWNFVWNVRHQPVYLSQSACFRNSNGALSCLSCHNPHQDARKGDVAFYNQKCAGCHNADSRPPAAACRANCIDCHMPRVSPQPYLSFTNHWIGVYPAGPKLKPR